MTVLALAHAVTLIVPGEPVPLHRARYSARNRRWYLPRESGEYRERVQNAWLIEGRPRLEGALVVSAEFVCARKPSHLKADGTPRRGAPDWPACDTDNLLKGVLDALQDDGESHFLFHDDRQVVVLERVRRRYTEPGEEPHTELELRALPV